MDIMKIILTIIYLFAYYLILKLAFDVFSEDWKLDKKDGWMFIYFIILITIIIFLYILRLWI